MDGSLGCCDPQEQSFLQQHRERLKKLKQELDFSTGKLASKCVELSGSRTENKECRTPMPEPKCAEQALINAVNDINDTLNVLSQAVDRLYKFA